VNTEIIPAESPAALACAVSILKNGGLVAFPTDTVYGLAAATDCPAAIDQLFVVKGRDNAKAIAVLIGDQPALAQVAAEVNEKVSRLVRRFWPGPLTLIMPRHARLPDIISPTPPGRRPTIGVRMPDHPVALALLQKTGPLAVTSANLSGGANTTTAQEVYKQLQGMIPLILDGGPTPGGRPSTVVDCTQAEPLVLREGPISLQELRAVLAA
jgi:L-threonylcarbamoyladenylate synthase